MLTLIDVATRTILGYYITINEEYNRFDILNCIKNAIEPRKEMSFSIPGLCYPENGGYPTFGIDGLRWAMFDEIELDNALAHHASDVVTQITEYLNAAMNFGPVSTPERRGIIERFFQSLETRGYHRLVSTTGTGITDPRNKNKEEDAVKYEISFNHIMELTEVLIANYNVTPHSALNNFSPLEVMKQRIERGMIPSFLEEKKQNNFTLLSYSVVRNVRGSKDTGRRPYVQIEGVEYRSEELSINYAIINKKIVLTINPDDMRTVMAFYQDGSELGLLYAAGKWAFTRHTLKQRKEINKYLRLNNIKLGLLNDPIQIYHDYLKQRAYNKKSERNKLGALNISIGVNEEKKNLNNKVISYDTHKTYDKTSSNSILSDQALEEVFESDLIRSLYK